MRKIILTLSFFLTINISFAFNLDDALEKLEDNAKVQMDKSLENNKGVSISLDSLAKDLKGEAVSKLDALEQRVNSKIDAYDEKITLEINNAANQIEAKIAELEEIKKRANKVITLVQIFLAILSFSTIALIYFIWRAYRKINRLYNMLDNVYSYKDLNARLTTLEKRS
ncbi:MAG: hypothetical protein HON42_04040 [Alphaproteobacteria bacterium]|jgi:hypothetical protein|nr:hypothetical protein [Alphaproteobacteria bacterium]MBT5827801.1 hypothetical protein [Alphaproteobacteria bacterium]